MNVVYVISLNLCKIIESKKLAKYNAALKCSNQINLDD